MVGYFLMVTRPEAEPTRDPPHDGPCPVCQQPITPETCRTVSVAWYENRSITLFYRLHRACADGLTPEESQALDELALAAGATA